MNLENKLYQTDSFVELWPTIENVREEISFFGVRYVYLSGEEETFPIDILAKRVIQLIRKTKYEFTDEERSAGRLIARKIDKIYADNDTRLESKWFITRFICYIRDNLRDGGYSPRFYWEVCCERKVFDRYTISQYKNAFHSEPNEPYADSIGIPNVGRIDLYRPPHNRRD